MKILICDQVLSHTALDALILGEVAVVRVKNFTDPATCEGLSERLLKSELYGKYSNAPKIGRVGVAFFETTGSPQGAARYFAKAPNWMNEIRAQCAPYASSIDRLRLQLDEAWPNSATLHSLNGMKMFAGLVRVFDEGSGTEAHDDWLDRDALTVDLVEDSILQKQFGANVYLKMPPAGGELVIWPISLDASTYAQHQNVGSYGVSESILPAGAMTLTPEVGELIIFDARNVHAVRAAVGGPRIAWSSFIGYRGYEKPLTVFS